MPESLDAVLIQLQPDENPAALLGQIKSADDFRRIATDRAAPVGKERPEKAPTETLVRSRPHARLGNTDVLFALDAGKWTEQPVVQREARFLVLVENKMPAKTAPFEEVRRQVEVEYRMQKQQELSRKLFQDLLTRYNVKLSPPGSGSGDKDTK